MPFTNRDRLLEDTVSHDVSLGRVPFFAKRAWNKAGTGRLSELSAVRTPSEAKANLR